MPTQPTKPEPPKPATPPPTPPPHQPPHQPPQQSPTPKPPPPSQTPTAGVAPPEPNLPIGARPHDHRDPQSAKFEAHAAPPHWDAPKDKTPIREEWTPKPALDPRTETPPKGYYADGMSAADEQRARSAWVEAHGLKAYDEATDQRPDDEKPKFDQHALAGGGAFVTAGRQRQVPGTAPVAKRE